VLNWHTVLAIDFNEAAAAVYRANFPGVAVECRPVSERLGSLPAADVILGGPPCQPFSQAGDGEGEADDRDCIPDYIAAVGEVRPRQFLMENVRGLLAQKHWPYFCRAVQDLEGHGYAVQWRLLDAVSYGVPQFRKRVWVWGIRNDLARDGARHRWPEPTHQWPPPVGPDLWGNARLLPGVTVGGALGLTGYLRMERGAEMCERHGERRDIPTTEPAPLITAGSKGSGPRYQVIQYDHGIADPAAPSPKLKAGGNYANGRQGGGCPPVLRVWGGGRNNPADENGVYVREKRDITDEPSTTIAGYNGSTTPFYVDPAVVLNEPAPAITGGSGKHHANGLSVVNKSWRQAFAAAVDAPSHTINGQSREPVQNWRDKGYVRRLSPAECARLQSVPDDFIWPDGISKTNAYRVIGNGWPCGMAAHLSRALAEPATAGKAGAA
jgi:site-specific DNA-cytosine methylase